MPRLAPSVIAAILSLVTCILNSRADQERQAALNLHQLEQLHRQGAFAPVCAHSPRLIEEAKGGGRHSEAARLLMQLASAQQSMGRVGEAAATLSDAVMQAQAARDPSLECSAMTALGANFALMRRMREADEALEQASRIAQETGDRVLQATVWVARGGMQMSRNDLEASDESFRSAIHLLDGDGGDAMLLAEALAGSADVTSLKGGTPGPTFTRRAAAAIAVLPDEYHKGRLLLRLGRCYRRLAELETNVGYEREAWNVFESAASIGRSLGNASIEGYALSDAASLYKAQGRLDEALILARRAVSLAQQRGMPDALYRWQWQTARLLRAKGDVDSAIDAYRNAASTLRPIRADVAIGYGNVDSANVVGQTSGFHQAVGDLFIEMADLLLSRASQPGLSDAAVSVHLREAREAMESLKAAELEDYFQTECVTLVTKNIKSVDAMITEGTAAVYFIPLSDRTEILLSQSGGRIKRVTADATRDELRQDIATLRAQLEDRQTRAYKNTGKRIHDRLIAPLRPTLDAERINTLVIVPDETLRTVPLAALWDGEEFLLQRYASCVVPGLTLVSSGKVKSSQVLAAGIAKEQGELSALPSVRGELSYLQQIYDADVLIDGQLTYTRLQRLIDAKSFSIIHFATHGEFQADGAGTYLMLCGERLGLEDLSRLIQPNQYRGAPVELLTLSCCQTASGSDDPGSRAALGLGGVALKAGARSALATLWQVNDSVSAELVCGFYDALRADPANRARALRTAQLKFVSDRAYRRYSHPCFWAPYLMIGAWQ